MLKFFRDKKDSWFVKGILVLTALSFMSLFGIQGVIELSQNNKSVLTVGSHKILTQELLNTFNQEVNALNKLSNGSFTVKDGINHGLLLVTLNKMASRAVMEETVSQMGLAVSPDKVRQIIKEMPMFADMNGNFSRSAFNEYLQNTAKTEKQFVDEMFLNLKAGQLLDAAKSATVVPVEMAEMAYQIQGEKRSADIFRIAPKNIKIKEQPTREELQKTYEEMSEDLIAPEYRQLSVMYLTLDNIKGQIQVSENDVQEAFEQHKSDYTVEEIRDVDQMLFDSQEQAQKAFDAVKNGKDFMKVASEMANQTQEQTNLGEVTPSTATGEWVDQVFKAKKNDVIAPVQTAFGWQILRVNKITPKIEKKFSDVKAEIEKRIKDSMAYDKMVELSTELDDRLGAGEKLEDVAKSVGIPVKKYDFVDGSGMDENGKPVNISKDVLSVAFITEQGRDTPMIEEGNGFFVLRVDKVQDPHLKTLEKAMPEVVAAWTAQKQKEAAKKVVQNVEEQIKKGQKMETIAQQPGVSYEFVSDLTRNNTVLPTTATYGLFTKNIGEIVNSSAPNGYVLVRVSKIKPADPEKDRLGVLELRRQMTEEAANEKANTLLASFGEELNLQVDENAVKQAHELLGKSTTQEEEY